MSDILFLAPRIPFPPNRGDKIRSHHLLRHLATLAPVHVGCFTESQEDRDCVNDLARVSASHCVVPRTKPLALAGVEAVLSRKPVSLAAFHSGVLERWVRQTIASRPISTIVVFSGQMGQYIPADFEGRVIVDLCDVDSAKFEGYAEAGDRVWINEREGRLLAIEEERLAKLSDAAVLISDAEAALFRSRLSVHTEACLAVIGNGIDVSVFDYQSVNAHTALEAEQGPHLVFTGQMDYSPNETAALWVIEHLLPAVRKRFSKAQFHIVGRAPTRALKKQSEHPGVEIWGEVPDVRPFLAAATCVLAPLQIARGVQNKVLEAMAMARPVLLTPEAATGIEARDGEHWMMEYADPEAMTARLEALMADSDNAVRMGQAARQFVLANHDWNAKLAPLSDLINGPAASCETRNAA